jgi:Flp pilus assembly protein TadG
MRGRHRPTEQEMRQLPERQGARQVSSSVLQRSSVRGWVLARISLPLRRRALSWGRPSLAPARPRPETGGGRPAGADAGRDQRGQGLVEFALVFPIFILMVMATIEFGLAFNAILDVNYASRNAALLAAEAGNTAGADCVILESVESDIGSPASRTSVSSVDIYWADPDGGQKSGKVNHYVRGGSTSCTYRDGSTITVPYTATVTGYPDTQRCNALKGCGSSHPGLDTIGVSISYQHQWRTPMAAMIPGVGPGSGMAFIKSNAMRMEPIL